MIFFVLYIHLLTVAKAISAPNKFEVEVEAELGNINKNICLPSQKLLQSQSKSSWYVQYTARHYYPRRLQVQVSRVQFGAKVESPRFSSLLSG